MMIQTMKRQPKTIIDTVDDIDEDGGKIHGVQEDQINNQGGNTNNNASRTDDEGRRRSNRATRPPSAYDPNFDNNTYAPVEETIHINVQKEPKMRKYTEVYQMIHVLRVALVQTYKLKKGLNMFGTEGRNAV